MLGRRRMAVLLAVAALVVIVGGCGAADSPALQQGLDRLPQMAESLRLPAVPVPVTLGEDGRVTSVGGFDAEVVDGLIDSLFGYRVLNNLNLLTPDQVAWLKRSNIQHVTVALRPKGAYILVNGKALPYLDWEKASDEDVLQNLVDVLERTQQEAGSDEAFLISPANFRLLKAGLPVARSLGLQLDVALPRDPAFEPIPLPTEADFDLAMTDAEVEDQPLNAASIELTYKELPDGTWVPSLLGLSTTDLQTVTEPLGLRIPTWRLRRDIQRRLAAEGFRSLGLETRADGVFVTVDGRLLPHLAWSNATLSNLAQVLHQLYPPGTPLPSEAAYVPVLRSVAPILNDLSLVAVARFPAADRQ